MRKTFPNVEQMAHVWAQGEQSEGKCANAYFDGSHMYSYGRHYLAARIITDPKTGKRVALINNYRYSNTTTRHLAAASNAVRGLMPSFEVVNPHAETKQDHRANLKAMGAAIWIQVEALMKARAYHEYRRNNINLALAAFREYSAHFKLAGKEPAIKWDLVRETEEKQRAFSQKSADKKEAAEYTRRVAQVDEVLKEWEKIKPADIAGPGVENAQAAIKAAWRRGVFGDSMPSVALLDWALENKGNPEPEAAPYGGYNQSWNQPTMLRLSADGKEVITTRGARVPADHARRVFNLWQRLQSKMPPQGWERTGASAGEGVLGHFKLDRIEVDGTLKAGCHTISADEIREFAAAVGWDQA